MRLPRPLRTSSFRLTILYAAMFSLSGLVVFAIVAWLVSSFMAEQLDATVANELAEVQADAGGQDTQALKRVIDGLTVNSPGIYYLLQASDAQPPARGAATVSDADRPSPLAMRRALLGPLHQALALQMHFGHRVTQNVACAKAIPFWCPCRCYPSRSRHVKRCFYEDIPERHVHDLNGGMTPTILSG